MNNSGLKVLSEIFRDVAQVCFASAVVAQLVAIGSDRNWLVISFGLSAALVFWFFSVNIAQRGKL